MDRQDFRIVTRAAIGITAGLAACGSAALAAETGDALLRTAWSTGGGHFAQIRDVVLLLVKEPTTAQFAALAASALVLGCISVRSLRSARLRAIELRRGGGLTDRRRTEGGAG